MRYRLWAHQLEKSLPSSAFPHKRCWSKILVKRHQLEVGSLSCEAKFEPLSISLQYGIRFFQPPLPTISSVGLATVLPIGKIMGLSRSTRIPVWGRSCHSAGGATTATGERKTPAPDHVPFGSSLAYSYAQHLWLVGNDDIYQQFTYVDRTTPS